MKPTHKDSTPKKRESAFDRYFKHMESFTDGYGDAVSALAYTKEQARDIFQEEEIGKWHNYTVKLDEISMNWVHWHGSIDDDGQMGNWWHISPEYEGKKGAKPVWNYVPDWHLINKGHVYERHPDHWSRCIVCDPPLTGKPNPQ